jgi:RHS repeat-associated protein
LAQPGRPYDLFAFKINYNQVEDNASNGVVPLYNGNISETYWRSYNDNVLRNYGYTYDALNRLEEAFYQKPGYTQPNVNNYREKLTYDSNGNITHLWRNGELDATNLALEIDDLTYTYAPDSNLLLKVTDATASPAGFQDDATDGTLASDTTDDYLYDAMGNMVQDENKNIRSITYNHLNLPTFIDFGSRGTITYLYDATGRKVRKVVQNNVLSQNTVTDYANGFQYENNILQFFPTAEGYVSRLTTKIDLMGRFVKIPIEELPEDQFSYVYNYTDHLGNIRLSYAQDPDTQQLKIVEQNHYYPFGLRHTNYSGGKMQVVKEQEFKRMAPTPEELLSYKYKYNGKEWQDELGLNVTSMDWRQYDSSTGRFNTIDPETDDIFQLDKSPYSFSWNNPILYNDPDGRNPIKNFFKRLLKSGGKKVIKKAVTEEIKQLLKSQKSLKKLITEHKQKLKDFNKDPIGNSSKEALEEMKKDNPTQEELLKRAKGRATALEKQIAKQEGELAKVEKSLKEKGYSNTMLPIVTPNTNPLKKSNVVKSYVKTVDFIENIGVKTFGDNDFGKFVDEMNPVNLGLAPLLKEVTDR